MPRPQRQVFNSLAEDLALTLTRQRQDAFAQNLWLFESAACQFAAVRLTFLITATASSGTSFVTGKASESVV